MSGELWYCASPYSRFKGGHDAAFEAVAEQTALLLECDIEVFSPIVHSHPVSKYTMASNLSHSFWLSRDLVFMSMCTGMIQLRLDGWRESEGMEWERAWFVNAGKIVIPMEPWLVPEELRRAAA